ncbi:ABC transporter substrate-binding protein [Corynebacterium tapiri]|uniref:ABC transporter substrate-binding protein n=1 Tax=Corynebacterium tapiri TaxID=1448266 RepID=A0A5C4U7G5_9CORY|nr:ABC transporter substrate-binding protein [Corynebacterium tapiri]TNL99825.1 ABC transporter substrate-binding protein [Corynebacterium tapiri]
MKIIRSVAIFTATSLTLVGCVTNMEKGVPDAWQPVSAREEAAVSALVPPEVAADGKLTVGTNPPFAPLEFKNSSGELIGVEMDLAQAIAQTMGLEFAPVEQDFSLILPSIQAGSVEMGASGFTDNPERREAFDFIDFLYAGIQWTQQPGDSVDPDNACGLTVAVQRTTVSETDDVRPKSEQCEREGKEPITVLSYDTSDNAALALMVGRADAYSADSPVAAYAVEKSRGQIEPVGQPFDSAPFGFAVPKDSALGPAVAAALNHLIETGEYQEILDRWGIREGLVDQALMNELPVEEHTA